MNPYFLSLSEIPEKELFKGFHAKLIHMQGVTIAHLRIEKGSALPEHFHVHEQVSNVISGEFEMTVGGQKGIHKSGDVIAIPSNTPHSGKALTDCYIIDVFQPVREDYK